MEINKNYIDECLEEFDEKFPAENEIGHLREATGEKTLLFASHWAVKSFLKQKLHQVEQRILEEVDLTRDDDSCECDNCHRIRRYLKNPKREMNSIIQKVANKVEQNSLKNFVERLRGDLMLHPDLENLNEIITKRLDKIIKN